MSLNPEKNRDLFSPPYRHLSQFHTFILPGTAGTLYVVNSSRNLLEAMATWGSLTNASGAPK